MQRFLYMAFLVVRFIDKARDKAWVAGEARFITVKRGIRAPTREPHLISSPPAVCGSPRRDVGKGADCVPQGACPLRFEGRLCATLTHPGNRGCMTVNAFLMK